ncbi:unnamed protein product, partial [Durusdinium trenchii]
VVLRRVYHMTKDITAPGKSPLWKCIVRMVDKKANGVYLEFRSYKGKADLEKQAKMRCENKFVVVQGLLLSQNNKFLGGFCADMSNRASKVKVHPMAESHQTAMDMAKVVPTSQSDLATLKQHCRDYQRADLIGLVMSKNIPQTKTVSKAEVWMKDESEMELLVSLWGPKYTAGVRDNVEVGMVLQLENCLLSKKEDGSVEASCQDWLENDRHKFARMMVDPKSDRAEVLKLLSPNRGQQISTPWAGVGTESIEVVLQNVWVTEVTGWPVYTPCSECHTKIDPESGECKKKSTGCASTPASEVKVLATLNLSDPTGCVEKVLADEEALCVMTNIKLEEKAKLVKMLERHGMQFLCFRQPVDVRLGTAPYMTKSRRDKGAALGTQDTETQTVFAAESQFQVLAAKPCFAVGFKDDERPSLRKILSHGQQQLVNCVYPIKCVYQDVSYSSLGIIVNDAPIHPSYVSIVAKAWSEPTPQPIGQGENQHVLMVHEEVTPYPNGSKFRVEAVCSIAECHIFNTGNLEPRLLVGRLTRDGKEGQVTLLAERAFPRTSEQAQVLDQERDAIGHWSEGTQIHTVSKKRPADDLVTPTPLKRMSGAWAAP